MKANELMIGDLIIVKSNGVVPDSIMKIITLDTGFDPERPTCFAKPICEYEDCDNELGLDELKPIPLTPEILEKNGFEIEKTSIVFEDWKGYKHKEFDFWCNLHGEYGYYVSTQTIEDDYGELQHADFANIHYVHELQHALRLCGLTDLADNFNV